MEIEIVKPFGPSIVKIKLPDQIIDAMNEFTDGVIDDEIKSNALNYGDKLVGNVKQEIKLDIEFMKQIKWVEFLGKVSQIWIAKELGKKLNKFQILNSWIVRQFKNEYNPIHWHSGHLSGAGFLKVPNNLGSFIQKKDAKDYPGGMLELIHGSKAFLSDAKFRIKPEIGDFYFFPNYLMHTVYPFKDTKEERRSISFNAKIDEEIYNDFS